MTKEKKPLNNLSNLFYLAILLLCCLVAYWPITFSVFSLKNDALNYFLPVRHQISEAIYYGYWPFWSPYFNLGYPLHGDMQSGVWNPFVQLISLAGPYTLKTLQLETALYVFLSGVSMYYLLRHFKIDKIICLFGASAYMLCGYNSDSAQFLNWICSSSFIPMVILFYFKTITEQTFKSAIFCGFFLYLLFTTAYPADFILLFYLMLAIFIWNLFVKENRQQELLVTQLKLHTFIFASFFILSLPAIISYAQYLPLTERGSGTSIEQALSNSLHPKLLFSYLTPLPIWKAHGIGITDPLERNSYVGLITFCLIIYSFLIKTNNKYFNFFKWAFVIFTLFSFGSMGILRTVAYYILPLMDSFRHPANAKIFTLFFGCLLASFSLQFYSSLKYDLPKKMSFLIIMLLIIVLTVWASFGKLTFLSKEIFSDLNKSQGLAQKLKLFLESLSFSDLLLINIFIQIPFLILFYLFFVKKLKLKFLVFGSLLNCVIHTMLFQPYTVVKKDSASSIQKIINNVSLREFPIPQSSSTLKENSSKGEIFFKEIGSANMYNKLIGRIDYRISPSNLLTQNEFWFNSGFKDIVFAYPIFYKADSAIFVADSAIVESVKSKKIVLLDDEKLINQINQISAQDNNLNAKIIDFSPTKWTFRITSSVPGFYSLFQNYYPRWNIKANNKKIKIHKSNISFIGFVLPAGSHVVEINYKTNDLKISFILSWISIFSVLFLALLTKKQSKFSSPS